MTMKKIPMQFAASMLAISGALALNNRRYGMLPMIQSRRALPRFDPPDDPHLHSANLKYEAAALVNEQERIAKAAAKRARRSK